MGSFNLGYLFYRNINEASDIDFGKNIITKAQEMREGSEPHFGIKDSLRMTFTTTYPGLAIGLGYNHDVKNDDDFKLGFSFDYTTGLPYIPGSSIKGTIRSVFPLDAEDSERIAFINSLLDENYSYDEIYRLEKSIFGKHTNDTENSDSRESKDSFYDGYFSTGTGGFLSSDYITPHKDEITSPDPLKFLKISSGVKVTLQFSLADNDLITKKKRFELYTKILEWTGLGAKTNVGYGVVDNIKYEYGDDIYETNIEAYFKKLKQKEDQELELQKTPEDIENEKCEGLIERNNINHMKKYIEQNKENPLAQACIEKMKQIINPTTSSSGDPLAKIKDAKSFKKTFENLIKENKIDTISRDDIKKRLVEIYSKQKQKKQDNFFSEAQIARFLGDDFQLEIKKEVGRE